MVPTHAGTRKVECPKILAFSCECRFTHSHKSIIFLFATLMPCCCYQFAFWYTGSLLLSGFGCIHCHIYLCCLCMRVRKIGAMHWKNNFCYYAKMMFYFNCFACLFQFHLCFTVLFAIVISISTDCYIHFPSLLGIEYKVDNIYLFILVSAIHYVCNLF